MPPTTDSEDKPAFESSSVRTPRHPIVPRKIWILGSAKKRLDVALAALERAGHAVRSADSGAELAPALREFRPDLIIIDMQDEPDRARHVAAQLRADRATRQLPIILVGARGVDVKKGDKPVTGPTRRYALSIDSPSVLNAIVAEL